MPYPHIRACIVTLLVLLLLGACSQRQAEPPGGPLGLGAALPTLADLGNISKLTASTPSLTGAQFLQIGGNHSVTSDALELTPAAGELAYAIYSFTVPMGCQVQSITVTGSSPQPTAWLGVSDFQAGEWHLSEFDPASGTVTVGRPSNELTSADCKLFVAVIGFADALTIGTVSIQHDGDTALSWNHSWGTDQAEDLRYIDVDAAGNCYVALDHRDLASGDDVPALLKYSPDGALLAARLWDDPALLGNGLGVRDFFVLPDGSTYTAFVGGEGSGRNCFYLRTDADLNLVWCRRFDTGGIDSHGGMGLDASGNVVAHINVVPDVGVDHGMLIWLAPDGSLLRQLKLNEGTPDGNLILRRITFEPLSGDLLLEGNRLFYPSPSVGTHTLLRLADDGTLKFSKILTTSQFISATFSENGVTYDNAGNMLTVCASPDVNSSVPDSILLLRTDPAGNMLSATRVVPVGSPKATPQRIDTTSDGEPFIEFVGDFGTGNLYGALHFSRENLQPLRWETFFGGALDNDIAEFCGSYYLGLVTPGALQIPSHASGDQFTITDISSEVALVNSGDTLTPDPGSYVTDQAASQLVDFPGTQDAATSSDVQISRFIP